MATPTAAISSSAWKVLTPQRRMSASRSSIAAGRRDRVAGVDELLVRQLCRGDEAEDGGFVAGDLAIGARLDLRLRHLVLNRQQSRPFRRSCSRPSEPACSHHVLRVLGELVANPLQRDIQAAARTSSTRGRGRRSSCSDRLPRGRELALGHGFARELRHRHADDAIALQAAVFERADLVRGLLEVRDAEGVGVDDRGCRRAGGLSGWS